MIAKVSFVLVIERSKECRQKIDNILEVVHSNVSLIPCLLSVGNCQHVEHIAGITVVHVYTTLFGRLNNSRVCSDLNVERKR